MVCWSRFGKVRLASASPGLARRWQYTGRETSPKFSRFLVAGLGIARAQAGRDVWRWPGEAGQGDIITGLGRLRPEAFLHVAGPGEVWHRQPAGRATSPKFSILARSGRSRHGQARHGDARRWQPTGRETSPQLLEFLPGRSLRVPVGLVGVRRGKAIHGEGNFPAAFHARCAVEWHGVAGRYQVRQGVASHLTGRATSPKIFGQG